MELFIHGKLLDTSFLLKIILFVMPTDKKKPLSFLFPREGYISAHDSMAPGFTLVEKGSIAFFCVMRMKILCVLLIFTLSLGIFYHPREPVVPGLNKPQKDGAGWELWKREWRCQLMSGARPWLEGTHSKAGGSLQGGQDCIGHPP